ncbi:thioredoxin [Candidatus Woesearchaeota archaeon]|nr:thioredoxin [Candidatus Woesearchaeota archaeon]
MRGDTVAEKKEGRLLDFYGTECTHCHEMDPLVEKLEKELKIKVEKLEVWHNAKNAALLEKCDTQGCGGVPFFYNEKTKKAICGAVDYATLKKWAQG